MTAIVRPAESVPGLPDLLRRRVTGSPTEVETTLAMVRQSGHLVAATAPRQLYTHDPRVTVLVTLRRTPVPLLTYTPPQVRRTRLVKPLLIGGTSVAVLAGLAFGLYTVARATVHAAAAGAPIALGVLVTLGLVLMLVRGGKSACSGLHCGGCRH